MTKKLTVSGSNNQLLNVGGNLNLQQPLSGSHIMGAIFGEKDKKPAIKHKVLLFTANQANKQLQFELEWQAIEQSIIQSKHRDLFKIQQLFAATPQSLNHKIAEFNPSIIQFSGHSNKTSLQLRSATNANQPLTAPQLSQLLSLNQATMKCLILNSCFSLPFAKALTAKIPNIIAMKKRIKDSDARTFIAGFYQGLGAGKPITQAFEYAKVQLCLADCEAIDTPTLLQSS